MNFRDYIKSLNDEQLKAYALSCNTTPGYIRTHLLSARKKPKRDLLIAFSTNSGGLVTEYEVLRHFGFLSEGDVASLDNKTAA